MRYQSRLISAQPVQSNSPQLFQSLASRLSAFSEQEETRLDQAVAKKAKEKGLIDAQGKTSITLRNGDTIADNAWNEGAIASHVSAVKLDMFENLSRIEAESPRNPEAYAAKAQAYSSGLLQGVPDNIKPLVQDELAETILKSSVKIRSDLVTFQREQHDSQMSTAQDLYQTQAENAAKEGDVQTAFDSHEKAIGLVDSRERAGMIDAKTAETARRNITRETEDSAIYGEMAREIQKGRGGAFIKKFRKMKSFGDRDPEYRAKMEKQMVSMMKESHAIEDAELAADTAARKGRWIQGERVATNLLFEGQLNEQKIKDMVKNDELDPSIGRTYMKAQSQGPEFSDGVSLIKYKANLLGYTESQIMTDGTLTFDDRRKLVDEHRKLREDKFNWRATQEGREGARRITSAFGIIKGVAGARTTKEDAQRAGMALTRYYDEMENIELEQRGSMAVITADNIVKDINMEIREKDLDKNRDKLSKRKYQTVEDIEAADIGDEEKKTEINQLNRLLKRIKRLESE